MWLNYNDEIQKILDIFTGQTKKKLKNNSFGCFLAETSRHQLEPAFKLTETNQNQVQQTKLIETENFVSFRLSSAETLNLAYNIILSLTRYHVSSANFRLTYQECQLCHNLQVAWDTLWKITKLISTPSKSGT